MTKRELIDYCLTYLSVYEDYPFDDTSAVMRHKAGGKMFALIGERNVFASVTPGWHMNKVHWNTVTMGGDVSGEELYDMIQHSFDLTKPKVR